MTRPNPSSRHGRIAGFLLFVYKQTLSRVFFAFGARCRHLPTCSEYAAGAFSAHGAWAGAWMTLARLLRCHPFGSDGFDPVPPLPQGARWWAPWRYGDWRWTTRPFPPGPEDQTADETADRTNDGNSNSAPGAERD